MINCSIKKIFFLILNKVILELVIDQSFAKIEVTNIVYLFY